MVLAQRVPFEHRERGHRVAVGLTADSRMPAEAGSCGANDEDQGDDEGLAEAAGPDCGPPRLTDAVESLGGRRHETAGHQEGHSGLELDTDTVTDLTGVVRQISVMDRKSFLAEELR